jgi:putative ABC transport system permease protein
MLKTTLRDFVAQKGRLVLSALAVTLSVAFMAGTLLLTDTITHTLTRLTASTAADLTVSVGSNADAQVPDAGILTVDAVGKVRAIEGVRDTRAVVESERLVVVDRHNRKVVATSGASFLGRNWQPTERLPVRLTSGREPRGRAEVILDGDSADACGVRLGDALRLVAAGGVVEVTVVGIATVTAINPGATLVFLDSASAAATLLGRPGSLSAVEIEATAGTDPDALKQRVQTVLGPGVTVATRAETARTSADDIGQTVAFLTVAMLGFGAIALLVGTFLIFNTFTMLVAARTRAVGLLRALGASRAQVSRSVLIEALLLGLIGATLGLLAGAGLAAGVLAAIDGLGVELRGVSLQVQPHTPITAYLVGVGATLISAYVPARRAARIAPMAALREAGAPPVGTGRIRIVTGGLIGAFGLTGLAVGAARPSGTGLAAGVIASLVAAVVLGPLLARLLVPALSGAYPRLFGAIGRLSRRNTVRNPRRTGATAAALMIGIAVVTAVAVVTSSMDESVQRRIDRTLGADYVVGTTDLADPPLGAEVAGIVRGVPGVARVVRTKVVDVVVGSDADTEQTWLLGIDPDAGAMTPVRYERGSAAESLAPGRIAIGSTYAREHGLSIGSSVTLRAAGERAAILTVGGILAEDTNPALGRRKEKVGDSSRHGSRPTVGINTLDLLVPGTPDDTLRVELAKDADPRAAADALRAALVAYPQAEVRGPAEYKALASEQLRVLLFMVYGLLALTIVIAVLGVVNTLALSVVERTREIGLLRAIGASRRQVRRLIRLESTAISGYGALLGLVLGLAWGAATQRVLADDGVDVLTVPWTTIVVVTLGSAVVGRLAAVVPARRAARMRVLSAIAASE